MKIKAKKDMPLIRKGDVFYKKNNNWYEVDGESVYFTLSSYLDWIIESSQLKIWFEVIEEEKQRRWKPEINDIYFTVDEQLKITERVSSNNDLTLIHINQNNAYRTKTEAKKHKRFLEFQGKLREITDGYEFVPSNINWYLLFDCYTNTFKIHSEIRAKNVAEIYYSSEEKAQEARDMANKEYKDLFIKD